MGVHWKIQFLGDVFHEKPIYWGELSKKRGLGQFAALREGEGWQKRAGEVFLRGVWCPNAHYVLIFNFKGNPEISSENNHSIKVATKPSFIFEHVLISQIYHLQLTPYLQVVVGQNNYAHKVQLNDKEEITILCKHGVPWCKGS